LWQTLLKRRTGEENRSEAADILRSLIDRIELRPNQQGKLEIIVDKPYTLQVDIYNKLGQKVVAGTAENLPAGQAIKSINASKLSSGIYHVAVLINGKMYTLNMVSQH